MQALDEKDIAHSQALTSVKRGVLRSLRRRDVTSRTSSLASRRWKSWHLRLKNMTKKPKMLPLPPKKPRRRLHISTLPQRRDYRTTSK
jgi:hypothetical protein